MADQKIELEIVLDDGSIKKAFGTIRKEAEKAEKESGNLLGGLGGSLVVLNQGIELFDKFASGIKKAAVEMINLSLEAEKVRVVNAQFAQLAQQNGIAQESFNAAIQESIAGLIDDEDALQLANNAMIRLGQTAQRLPEIFELARKASASGFGDMAANAEALTNAIQTGQTRQLRSLGIIADVTKAQNEFAKSIGLTAAQLTEEQKAYVNANTILEATSKKFKNADADIKTFSDSLARFKVASNDAFERFAVGFDRAFGPSIKAFIDTLTESMNGNGAALKANKISAENLAGAIAMAEAKIVSLNEKLANARTDTQFNTLNRQINETNTLLTELQKRQAAVVNTSTEQANLIKAFPKYQEEIAARTLNEQQKQQAHEAELARQTQLQQSMAGFQAQENAARQQSLQYQTDFDLRQQEMALLHEENLRLIVENGIIARANIEKQYSDAKGFTEAERNALQLEQIEAQNAQVLAAEQAYQAQSADGFTKWVNQNKKSFSEMAAAAKITFVSQIGGAFAAFGQALAKGEDAMAAFGKAILGTLGDIAMQMGQSFILQGIAMSLNPLTPGAGVGLITAGAALSVFGGFLKGISGGAGGAGSSASAGGGVASQGSDFGGFNAANPITDARVNPNTVVNFTIQGDVLDSDNTQNRIVQLLNDAIDTKGAVVRGI